MKQCVKVVVTTVLMTLSMSAAADWKETVATIQSRMKALEPPLQGFDVTIDVPRPDQVLLKGRVSSAADSDRIEQIALNTAGVKEVSNNLAIEPQAAASIGNTAVVSSPLADSIRAQLQQNVDLQPYRIRITEDGGKVVLEGTVGNPAEAQAVERLARGTTGVQSVVNKLAIAAAVPDAKLEESVMAALRTEHPQISKNIRVQANDGVVTINGDQRDHWDVDKILSTSLMVEGVRNVQSEMTINGGAYTSHGVRVAGAGGR